MDGERAALVRQVLDNYLAVQLAADGPGPEPMRRLAPLLDGLSTADLRAIAAGLTILADALRCRETSHSPGLDGRG
jgi:hypothetical protein